MRIAVPTQLPGGLESSVDTRFEFAECFTLVDHEEGKYRRVHVVPNPPYEEGLSLTPVNLLLRSKARAVIVEEIGILALAAFRMEGIEVYERLSGNVAAAVRDFTSGFLSPYQVELKSPVMSADLYLRQG